MAIVGAFTLAEQLAREPSNPEAAFRRYEAEHRRRVEPRQRNVRLASTLLVPTRSDVILLRNLVANRWPLPAAIGWAGRVIKAPDERTGLVPKTPCDSYYVWLAAEPKPREH
jgi:2-polyprenyl-6-methoxyphenol hydroxylase-like FAD-dependent oxidoreductase